MKRQVVRLQGIPQSVPRARRFVSRTLGPHHPAAAPAALLVSELATNAVMHSDSGRPGGTFAVAVEVSARTVRIEVTDAGGLDQPRVRHPRGDSQHGRGLALVEVLSSAWGTQTAGAGRRVTWCDIAVPQPSQQVRRNIA